MKSPLALAEGAAFFLRLVRQGQVRALRCSAIMGQGGHLRKRRVSQLRQSTGMDRMDTMGDSGQSWVAGAADSESGRATAGWTVVEAPCDTHPVQRRRDRFRTRQG